MVDSAVASVAVVWAVASVAVAQVAVQLLLLHAAVDVTRDADLHL